MAKSRESRKELHRLTQLQLDVLGVIWSNGEATAMEVCERLEESRGLSRKTIGTLLRRLERYGLLTHRSHGREFIYRALVTAEEVRHATVESVVESLFEGDAVELLTHAVRSSELHAGDLDRIESMLRAARRTEEDSR